MNISGGSVPQNSVGLAKYLAKYISRPNISLKRIKKYSKGIVEYVYKSHMTKKKETEKVDVITFIGRLVQQILPKWFQVVRYYGLQATKTFEEVKELIESGINKTGKVVEGCYKVVRRIVYRKRYKDSTGIDPFKCPFCGETMDIWLIWSAEYGTIFDEEKRLKKGVHGVVNSGLLSLKKNV